MRVVLQRVSRASVAIVDGAAGRPGSETAGHDGGETASRIAGSIGRGFCLLVGFTHGDSVAEVEWMADKIAGLRLFTDGAGKMNLGLEDVGGALLVVSQFTLYGDAAKGRRPSFTAAARPDVAIPLYERFCTLLAGKGFEVATGRFGADMLVEVHNDGPVTLVLEREAASTPDS